MAPSSSGSWDGAGADIIDLDRYMRGSVRPSRALSEETQHGEQLVVDCGKPNVDITTTRYKHYSHDSGVSDGSYRQRRTRKPHRRACNPSSPPDTYREPVTVPSANLRTPRTPRTPQRSSDSLRQFRTACEQVLVDQQKQIARVAEVCERLERAENGRATEGQSSAQSDPQKPKDERLERRTEISEKQSVKSKTSSKVKSCGEKKKMEVVVSRQSSETSDLSSSTSRSSGSDKNARKTDKHRTNYAEECKTYKIIMRKLDELNLRFGPKQRARRPPSSSSVSVCDKLVATDPTPRQAKTIYARDAVAKEHLSRSRVVQDSGLPLVEPLKLNGIMERIVTTNNLSVKYESSSCRSNAGEDYPSLSPFDLNDPMRLYAQAKTLQAIAATATTRRTQSVDVDSRTRDHRTDADRQFSRTIPSARSRSRSERDRSPSICAVCRAYLRSLRQCLIAPLSDFKDANT